MKEENNSGMKQNSGVEDKPLSQDQKLFDTFLDFVDKNLSDDQANFNIDALSDKLDISRSNLFRKLEKITGESPKKFIQSYRLERAAQLLREDYGNVTEVANSVGFSDQFYFSKCFKKRFRQSPKDYQLYHLNESPSVSLIKKRLKERSKEKEKSASSKPQTVTPIAELDRALVARGAQMLTAQQMFFNGIDGTPQSQEIFKQVMEFYTLNSTLNEALNYFQIQELTQKIQLMIDDEKSKLRRNGFYGDDRIDLFDIFEERIRGNALAVAVVCLHADILSSGSGYFQLKTKNYGKVFNLHVSEPFRDQPIAAGSICTGVLVGKNIIATAAHFLNGQNIADLRFVFDFVMQDPISPVDQIPEDNIYKGVEILERVNNPESDWMLVKLDRNVTGREIVVLPRKNIFFEQPVYVIGHPCGLPLKYAPGAAIEETNPNYFLAGLDVYSSNSGSPVFCAETHELLGIVSRGKAVDFRWTEEGWITLRYPKTDPNYKGSQCSRASMFEKVLK